MTDNLDNDERLEAVFIDSLEILLRHAKSEIGGKRSAAFLLSLWDGTRFKVDLQDLLYTDDELNLAMLAVFGFLHMRSEELDTFVTDAEMLPIIQTWGHIFRIKYYED